MEHDLIFIDGAGVRYRAALMQVGVLLTRVHDVPGVQDSHWVGLENLRDMAVELDGERVKDYGTAAAAATREEEQ